MYPSVYHLHIKTLFETQVSCYSYEMQTNYIHMHDNYVKMQLFVAPTI